MILRGIFGAGDRDRTVGLHKDLKKILSWWRNTYSARVRFHKQGRSEYVVTYKGEHVASVERALRSAYKKASLSSARPFHTLRHSFGAYLAMAGVSLYEIAKLMGHTYEQVTQLYAHLQPEHLHSQVTKIPQIRFSRLSSQSDKTSTPSRSDPGDEPTI